jgi:hypothetical protein
MGVILVYIANLCQTKVPQYKGEGRFSFLGDALDYATRPVELIRKATAQCGDIFSLQILTVYTVWLRGNALNKVYLETREDVWSFTGGMVCLSKLVVTLD